MKKVVLSALIVFVEIIAISRDDITKDNIKSVVYSFSFEHTGTIILKDGIGKLVIPPGFKYLEPEQAEKVLTEVWGNPKEENMTLGLLLPEGQDLNKNEGYVFNLQYNEIGYVKDDNADATNFDELLKQMKKEAAVRNENRKNAGYDPVAVVGWASKPYYDKSRNILHWAKELKFGMQKENTLNYNVRILGRKGVLVLNAIAPISDLKQVQADLAVVLNAVQFSENYQYAHFNPTLDKIAGGSISSLIAGKIFNKINLMDLFSQYWGVLVIAAILLFRPLLDYARRRLNDDPELAM